MEYTRENPSPEYIKDIQLGTEYHRTHKTYRGNHAFQQYPILRQLCRKYNTKGIWDVGSGKGHHALAKDIRLLNTKNDEEKTIYPSWREALGVDEIYLWDPCVPGYDILPDRQFDGVMSVDVLHYLDKKNLPWFIDMMFSFAKQWVYSSFALYPGTKTYSDGREAHRTFETVEWWVNIFHETAKKYDNTAWEIRIEPKSPPICHRRFRGQGDFREEAPGWWKIFKPEQLKTLTKKQQEELIILAQEEKTPIDPRAFGKKN